MSRSETVRDAQLRPSRSSGGQADRLCVVIACSPIRAAVGTVIEVRDEPTVLERIVQGEQEDNWMSRRHASIGLAEGGHGVVVRDGVPTMTGWKASANGTWKGTRSLVDPTEIPVGETFRTGRTLWLVVRNPDPAPTESLLRGISPALAAARTELELVTSQVALRLERRQRVTQALLVIGPRGTGKQVVAREAVRLLTAKRSPHKVPFRQVAAPALSDGTTAADLFGVVDRYATDVKARSGYFEQAHGGVLFFDEVGDTPSGEQAKLLTALQEREVQRLGGSNTIAFDALVIAATNQDLKELVAAGRFRDDLIDRLGRFVINLPPLDARKEDIPGLAWALLKRHGFDGTFEYEVMERLLATSWPGNVRQLDARIERMVAVAQMEKRKTIDRDALDRSEQPESTPGVTTARPVVRSGRRSTPAREELLRVLEETGWNKTEVGRRYGKHPRQITRWMEYLGIER